jgi:hypothetical protein
MKIQRAFNPGAIALFFLLAVAPTAGSAQQSDSVMDIANRRELFIDDYLPASRTDLALQMHRPQPREIVMVYDQPWEGSGSCYQRIIRADDAIRMYYMGAGDVSKEDGTERQVHRSVPCLATSADGIHWDRPDLGLFDFDGAVEWDKEAWIAHPVSKFPPSKHNNIVWSQPRLDNFTPFLDTNPACPPDERYKAVGLTDPDPQRAGAPRELSAYKSADGIRWSYVGPIFNNQSDRELIFDTENNAFWDSLRKCYWCYLRGYHNVRDIRVATSTDFRTWTKPQRIKFDDDYGHAPALYINQIEPYYRNPELFVGFPARYNDRVKDFSPAAMAALPGAVNRENRMKFNPRYGTVVTDTLLVTSRDGYTFHLWDEPFIPPGPERLDTWAYGDMFQSLGLLETPATDPTAPPELSFYVVEGKWIHPSRLRRYTIRIDGFVSLHASRQPGEFVTKPLRFSGSHLTLNFSTSGAGSVRVELENEDGTALPGFSKSDCDVLFGDTLDRTVTWQNRSDLSALAGKPICIRMFLSEADIYSLKFSDDLQR